MAMSWWTVLTTVRGHRFVFHQRAQNRTSAADEARQRVGRAVMNLSPGMPEMKIVKVKRGRYNCDEWYDGGSENTCRLDRRR